MGTYSIRAVRQYRGVNIALLPPAEVYHPDILVHHGYHMTHENDEQGRIVFRPQTRVSWSSGGASTPDAADAFADACKVAAGIARQFQDGVLSIADAIEKWGDDHQKALHAHYEEQERS